MNNSGGQEKFNTLRQKYPVFTYQNYSWEVVNDELIIGFYFFISPDHTFRPSYKISIGNTHLPPRSLLDCIVFHMGMVECVSYWKTTCSPVLQIKGVRLNRNQVDWWKGLFYNGLGEFLHLNRICLEKEEFLEITADEKGIDLTSADNRGFQLRDETLIPVGGGKDSAVTLSLLKDNLTDCMPLTINEIPASTRTIDVAGLSGQTFQIKRILDPHLLEMNHQGFLNGHTPFSAMLAFASLLASVISGKKNVALSNESSANEPTIPGTNINHQYSKSFEFESSFRDYVFQYIHPEINYYSFLRPLNELQISGLFARLTKHHHTFRSCNAGSKQDKWCCNCSKCLFTYIMLSPFLTSDQLVSIYGADLFENKDLLPVMKQLAGFSEEKPFECVGTIDEVNAALCHTIRFQYKNKYLPFLLSAYSDMMGLGECNLQFLLESWNADNFLDDKMNTLLNGETGKLWQK